jgi:DNA-binding transcriptional regulator YhcF (GntR family)
VTVDGREKNISEDIRRELIQSIRHGEYKAGDRLPSTRELGRRFGISHFVVSVALKRLVEEGYVVKRQGSGTFVTRSAPGKESLLRIYFQYSAIACLKKALDNFKKFYPGLTVEIVKDWHMADVFVVGPSMLYSNAAHNVFLPLDKLIKGNKFPVKDFHPAALQGGLFRRKQLGVPYTFSYNGLLLNKKLCQEAGVEISSAWRLAEFADNISLLNKKFAGKGICPFPVSQGVMGTPFSFFGQFGAMSSDRDASVCLLDSRESLAAIEYICDLLKRMPDFKAGNVNILTGIKKNTTAITSILLPYFEIPEKERDNFSIHPFPFDKEKATGLNGSYLGINNMSKNPELAWKLIAFVTSEDEQNNLAESCYPAPAGIKAFRKFRLCDEQLGALLDTWPEDYQNANHLCTDDLRFMEECLTGWWKADNLKERLSSTAVLINARLNVGDLFKSPQDEVPSAI